MRVVGSESEEYNSSGVGNTVILPPVIVLQPAQSVFGRSIPFTGRVLEVAHSDKRSLDLLGSLRIWLVLFSVFAGLGGSRKQQAENNQESTHLPNSLKIF